jgi:hypothetical protein
MQSPPSLSIPTRKSLIPSNSRISPPSVTTIQTSRSVQITEQTAYQVCGSQWIPKTIYCFSKSNISCCFFFIIILFYIKYLIIKFYRSKENVFIYIPG